MNPRPTNESERLPEQDTTPLTVIPPTWMERVWAEVSAKPTLTFRNNVRDYTCPSCGGKRPSQEAGITYVCASGHAPAICKEVIR